MADLSDDALVIRGGLMSDAAALLERARIAYDAGMGYVLSVYAAEIDDLSLDEAVEALAERAQLPNTRIRCTKAGKLRAAGFSLEQTGENEYHYSVGLSGVPDVQDVARFIEQFEEPRRNPCPHQVG